MALQTTPRVALLAASIALTALVLGANAASADAPPPCSDAGNVVQSGGWSGENDCAVPGSTPAALLTITPASHAYGSVNVGSSVPFTFTITNIGTATSGPIAAQVHSLTGSGGFAFGTATCIDVIIVTLAPLATCTITITYTPGLPAGPATGDLVVSASPGGSASATLTGIGASCPHQNGLGQTYFDCTNPLGTPGNAATYNLTMAQEAANAWALVHPIIGGWSLASQDCAGSTVVTATNPFAILSATWAYAGPAAGHAIQDGTLPVCPTVSDPAWN